MTADHSTRNALRICAWCVGVAVVELGLYASYRGHDARFHWATHFLVGASAALVVMTIVARRQRTPVRAPLVWIVAAHLYAMFPDLLFNAGEIHRRWMDVFLGHISTHFVPGRNWTWYAVFLVTSAAYLTTVDRVAGADAT